MAIKTVRFVSSLILVLGLITSIVPFSSTPSSALNGECDYDFLETNTEGGYDPCHFECTAGTTTASTEEKGIGTERDYAGRPILSGAQITAIEDNQEVYEEAANEAGIPWQMLAAIHLRETGLKLENPSDGTGIYNYVEDGETYDEPTVTEDSFLEQSTIVAEFLKSKASGSNELSTDATKSSMGAKKAFYEFIGPQEAYADQAKDLKFTNDYDGSPEVMNKTDAIRDPTKNGAAWGQIKTEGEGLVYPANGGYGLYPLYATISGISLSSCGGGDLAEKVAQQAETEYGLWQSGAMFPGYRVYDVPPGPNKHNPNSFSKYSADGMYNYEWCAMFASWVINTAGKPLVGMNRGSYESYAEGFRDPARMEQNGFVVHHRVNGYDGYTPKRGDIATYNWDGDMSDTANHVNIIVAYNSDTNTITTIGGNESGGGSYSTNIVRKYENRSVNAGVIMSITEVRE